MKFHPWITWKPPSHFWISSYLHWLGCVWFLGLCLQAPSSNRIWICGVFCICMSHVSRIRLDSSTLIFKSQYVRHYVFVLVTLWTNSQTLDAGFLSGHCQVVFDLGRYRFRQLKFYFGFQGCTCNRNICLKGTRQVRFQTCFMNLTIYAIIRNHNPWEKHPGSPVNLWVFSCWVTGSTEQQRIDQTVQSSIFTNSLQSFLGWTVSSCNQLPKSTTVEMKWLCVWSPFFLGGGQTKLIFTNQLARLLVGHSFGKGLCPNSPSKWPTCMAVCWWIWSI